MFGECNTTAAPFAGAVAQLYLAHHAVNVAAKIIVRQVTDLKERLAYITAVARAAAELRHRAARIFKTFARFYFFRAWAAFSSNNYPVDAAHAIRAEHV
jgi:hypothetical protein